MAPVRQKVRPEVAALGLFDGRNRRRCAALARTRWYTPEAEPNKIVSSLFHVPPAKSGASQMSCGRPPAASTFFSLPLLRTRSNGCPETRTAESHHPSRRAAAESRRRRACTYRTIVSVGVGLAANTINRPSGEIALSARLNVAAPPLALFPVCVSSGCAVRFRGTRNRNFLRRPRALHVQIGRPRQKNHGSRSSDLRDAAAARLAPPRSCSPIHRNRNHHHPRQSTAARRRHRAHPASDPPDPFPDMSSPGRRAPWVSPAEPWTAVVETKWRSRR